MKSRTLWVFFVIKVIRVSLLVIVGAYYSFGSDFISYQMDFRGLHLPERVHVLDRFNGSEMFISNELAETARIWGRAAHALMHHAEKRVYDIHRSWVESCHRFVVNCWNRFT